MNKGINQGANPVMIYYNIVSAQRTGVKLFISIK